MTLSEDEWEEAHNPPVKEVVLGYLRDNPNNGFTSYEIGKGINLKLTPKTKTDRKHRIRMLFSSLFRIYRVKRACDKLVKEGEASKKCVYSDGGRAIYYRYNG